MFHEFRGKCAIHPLCVVFAAAINTYFVRITWNMCLPSRHRWNIRYVNGGTFCKTLWFPYWLKNMNKKLFNTFLGCARRFIIWPKIPLCCCSNRIRILDSYWNGLSIAATPHSPVKRMLVFSRWQRYSVQGTYPFVHISNPTAHPINKQTKFNQTTNVASNVICMLLDREHHKFNQRKSLHFTK